MTRRDIDFHPQRAITRGFMQMSSLLSLTLGPNVGVIWNRIGAGKPEPLTDSGLVARRVTAVRGHTDNVGAMIARQAAMTMHERYLDGAATAGTLALALLEQARRATAAGTNPMILRRGITRGIETACAALRAQAQFAETEGRLKQVALTATGDEELADVLGEMFDLLGKNGAYVVDEYAAPLLEREYIEGGRWSARPAARELMPPAGADLVLDHPLILVAAEKIERFEQIRPALEAALAAPDKPPLLVITKELGGEALSALTLNHTRGMLTAAGAIMLVSGDALRADLEDISLMTGATLAASDRGTPAQGARLAWLGRARQVILKRDSLTIIGGCGDKAGIQRRVAELRAQLRAIKTPNEQWEHLRLRIARLSGGIGILKIGALTFAERDERKALAKKAVRVLESALEGGIVPGGGVAYLNAIAEVKAAALETPEDRAGVEIVARALTAPFLQIVSNQGKSVPPVALHEVTRLGGDTGFDARTGNLVSFWDAGIVDSVQVLCAALETAASAAVMAMTTDVVIVGK